MGRQGYRALLQNVLQHGFYFHQLSGLLNKRHGRMFKQFPDLIIDNVIYDDDWQFGNYVMNPFCNRTAAKPWQVELDNYGRNLVCVLLVDANGFNSVFSKYEVIKRREFLCKEVSKGLLTGGYQNCLFPWHKVRIDL